MKYIEKVDDLMNIPAERVQVLESEILAMAPVIVAAQKLTMRWIKAHPINCTCYACQLENALADYYAECRS